MAWSTLKDNQFCTYGDLNESNTGFGIGSGDNINMLCTYVQAKSRNSKLKTDIPNLSDNQFITRAQYRDNITQNMTRSISLNWKSNGSETRIFPFDGDNNRDTLYPGGDITVRFRMPNGSFWSTNLIGMNWGSTIITYDSYITNQLKSVVYGIIEPDVVQRGSVIIEYSIGTYQGTY